MITKFRKLITTLLILTFIVSGSSIFQLQNVAYAITTQPIKVGDYVQFGSYYGEPILWKCVDTNDGYMLVSEFILTKKAFDAAESGFAGTKNTGLQCVGKFEYS